MNSPPQNTQSQNPLDIKRAHCSNIFTELEKCKKYPNFSNVREASRYMQLFDAYYKYCENINESDIQTKTQAQSKTKIIYFKK